MWGRARREEKIRQDLTAHLFVGVKSVDDQRQKLVDVSREGEGLGISGRVSCSHGCFGLEFLVLG